jgi:hypothetical protein
MLLQLYQKGMKQAQGKAYQPLGDQRVKKPKKNKRNLNKTKS